MDGQPQLRGTFHLNSQDLSRQNPTSNHQTPVHNFPPRQSVKVSLFHTHHSQQFDT